MQLPEPGQWFQNRYELGKLLGKGGFAAVFRAVDHEVGREVAIKILMPDHNGYEPGLVNRFLREGRIVAGLQDPHNITMFDFGRTEEDLLFMVFEYVKGSDLSKLLMRTGPMPENEVIHILQQLLSALREAHGAGILHRDIKPANVFIHSYMEDNRRVKLLDFGIAKPTMNEGEVDELEEETKSGMSPGTPRYMSPEQIYGDELTPASDIFSLGLVAYEMLSGRPAVQGRTTKETLLHQLSDKPILLPPFLRISPELRMLVDTMTRKRPTERYQSVQEVAQHLNAVASLSISRPLSRPIVVQTDEGMSEQTKQKLSTIGLVVGVLVVLAALAVPGYKVIKNIIDPPPPFVPGAPAPPGVMPAVDPVADLAPVADAGPRILDIGSEPDEKKSGCGELPEQTGDAKISFDVGVITKRYAVSVPRDYDPDYKHPIVLVFHGNKYSPETAISQLGLGPVASTEKFIVAAPQVPTEPDDELIITPWSMKAHIALIEDVLDNIEASFCADRSRVFLAAHGIIGKSVFDLACLMPVSGIATTSYLRIHDKMHCKLPEPVPQIHLVGMGNKFTPVKGTGMCANPVWRNIPLKLSEKEGFKVNECSGKEFSWHSFKHGSCITKACEAPYVSCRLDDSFEFQETALMSVIAGHCETKMTQFDVAQTMWRFFKEHGREIEVE